MDIDITNFVIISAHTIPFYPSNPSFVTNPNSIHWLLPLCLPSAMFFLFKKFSALGWKMEMANHSCNTAKKAIWMFLGNH